MEKRIREAKFAKKQCIYPNFEVFRQYSVLDCSKKLDFDVVEMRLEH